MFGFRDDPDAHFISIDYNLVVNYPVARIGQPGGESRIGSLFGQWDGVSATGLVLDRISFAAYGTSGQLQSSPAADVPLALVPEPASPLLAAVAALSLAAQRRRR